MTTTAAPTRVVIRPPNWLGDAVMALPAIAALRAHFATSHVTIAAAPAVAAIFREDTDAAPDRVVDLPTETRAAVALLEGDGFDLGVLFPNSFRSAWQFWRAGIPARWGVARSGRSLLLTRRVGRPRASNAPHQSDYYRALVRAFDIACPPDGLPRIAPRAPSVERALAVLAQHRVPLDARLVGLAPGAAYGQAKQWPPDRVAAVAAELVRRDRVTCLIVGATHDREAALTVDKWLRHRAPDVVPHVVDLTGRTSLGALVGLMSRMAVMMSNDSGAMHLAAAIGRPVVAVFGPTNERATRPLGDHTVLTEPVFCRPCMLRDCPIDHRCMKRIMPETVYAAITAKLPTSGKTPGGAPPYPASEPGQ